jgi:sigma-E factor negative regulatory protein RseA
MKMNDTVKEQLSALIDGELPDEERELLHKRLATDSELRAAWQRYHLIRDAMRENLPELISRTSDSVIVPDHDEQPVTVTPQSASLMRFARPAAGFAIAASVAMLAVFGVVSNRDQLSSEPAPQVAVSKPAKQLPDNFIVVPRTGWESVRPAVVSHLNSYLVDHSNYSGFGASQSIIPYTRVAGYDQPMPDKKLEADAVIINPGK